MKESTTPVPNLVKVLFQSVKTEHDPMKLRVEGKLPDALNGTLYRTGPAVFEVAGKRVSHFLEGDGGVSAVRFEQGAAYGAYKLVQSEGRKRELAEGGPIYGSTAPWHKRILASLKGELKNTGNTNVLFHQGKLYTLFETTVPTELDPVSLNTIGETRFGDTVLGAFSAHPHRIPARRTTYNFGLRLGQKTILDLYALPDEGSPSRMASIPLPAPVLLHDFIATENHLIFFVAPLQMVMWRAMLQVGSFSDLFRYAPEEGTQIIVVPIDRPESVRRFNVPAFFQWHFANAFERGDQIAIDFVQYADASSLFSKSPTSTPLANGRLVRAEVGLTKNTFTTRVLEGSEGDFPFSDPRFGGKEHSVIFRTFSEGRTVGLSRYDASSGRAQFFKDAEQTRDYSEGIFVPKDAAAKEGEGYLLSLVLDSIAQKSHVAVFDAEHLDDGPIARAHFEHAIPMTIHGAFVEAAS